MRIADLPMIMGALLVVVGTILVVVQFAKGDRRDQGVSRSAQFSPKGVTMRTTYPGLIMIGIGAVLLLAGRLMD